jgi:hypothetical protein
MMALAGPDHRIVATNAAYRSFTGRSGVIGVPCREAFPEIKGQQLYELFDRVYATGKPETGTEWRTQFDLGPGGIREVYADFTVAPRRAADHTINGLLLVATNVTDRVTQRRAAQQRAAEGAPESQIDPGVVAELQEALLPTALPVLPQLRIAARYLVAGHEQAAGGDWFDAIPLAGGGVALVVGDVVGHGVAASAAMGQLRAVLSELLAAEADLGRVAGAGRRLRRPDPRPASHHADPGGLRPGHRGVAVRDLRASSPAGGRGRRAGQVPGGHRHRAAGNGLIARPGPRPAGPGRTAPAVQRWPDRTAEQDHRGRDG